MYILKKKISCVNAKINYLQGCAILMNYLVLITKINKNMFFHLDHVPFKFEICACTFNVIMCVWLDLK